MCTGFGTCFPWCGKQVMENGSPIKHVHPFWHLFSILTMGAHVYRGPAFHTRIPHLQKHLALKGESKNAVRMALSLLVSEILTFKHFCYNPEAYKLQWSKLSRAWNKLSKSGSLTTVMARAGAHLYKKKTSLSRAWNKLEISCLNLVSDWLYLLLFKS